MRPKVVAFILLAGAVAIALILIIRGKFSSRATASIHSVSAAPVNVPASAAVRVTPTPAAPLSQQKIIIPDNLADKIEGTPQEYENYVDNRTEELQELAMKDNRDSLTTIISEFDNHDPRIRHAALDAAVQFGSRDAIPALQDAIRHTDDPQEKVDLQKAIDFLALPSMSEVASGQK